MKKIIFVCTGNTCRSPMAEMIMKHLLKNMDIKADISSAGIFALNGDKMAENTQKVLNDNNIECKNFSSRRLNEEMINSADYVFCMTKQHKNMLDFDNVYTLGDFTGFGDVSDPFGKDLDIYKQVYIELNEMCQNLILKIDW